MAVYSEMLISYHIGLVRLPIDMYWALCIISWAVGVIVLILCCILRQISCAKRHPGHPTSKLCGEVKCMIGLIPFCVYTPRKLDVRLLDQRALSGSVERKLSWPLTTCAGISAKQVVGGKVIVQCGGRSRGLQAQWEYIPIYMCTLLEHIWI